MVSVIVLGLYIFVMTLMWDKVGPPYTCNCVGKSADGFDNGVCYS